MIDFMRLILKLILSMSRLLVIYSTRGGARSILSENLMLRQQLVILNRGRSKAPNLKTEDRVVLAFCSLLISPNRLSKLAIGVAHSTLLKFHKALVKKKYSILFSAKSKGKPGPKGPSQELINLIVSIKQKNPKYGYPRISMLASEVLKRPIDDELVRRILAKYFKPAPGGGPSWLSGIGQKRDALWSVDLFRVESLCLRSYWIMVVMDQWSRGIIGFSVHQGILDGGAVGRMFYEVMSKSGRKPKYVSTDHDPLFRYSTWSTNLEFDGIKEIKTVPNIPWSHPFIERVIGTIRREYLNDIVFFCKPYLERKLFEFARYYNEARVHYSLDGATPSKKVSGRGLDKIALSNYEWRSYCGGRYQIPVPA